ncbi:MAG: hypothetical protein ACR2MB_01520 [Acidimicrobiales bacterium]
MARRSQTAGHAPRPSEPERHWWRKKWPSIGALLVVLGACTAVAAALAFQISSVLPSVGRDAQGEDPWTDPIGVEEAGPFQIAHIPDCANAPVVKIVLLDEETRPLWQVTGPAVPLRSFVVGVAPEGFTTDTPLRTGPPGEQLRLVVIRRLKGAAGIRYQASNLRKGRVVALPGLSRFTIDGFQTADVCGSTPGSGNDGSSSSTTPSTTLLGG